MLGDNNNKENNTNNLQPVDSPLLDESFADHTSAHRTMQVDKVKGGGGR